MPIMQQEIEGMTNDEKVALIIRIRETLEEEDYVDDEPEESAEELKLIMDRWQEYKANPSIAIPGDEAFKNLKAEIKMYQFIDWLI